MLEYLYLLHILLPMVAVFPPPFFSGFEDMDARGGIRAMPNRGMQWTPVDHLGVKNQLVDCQRKQFSGTVCRPEKEVRIKAEVIEEKHFKYKSKEEDL